jgi:hypothetical protein
MRDKWITGESLKLITIQNQWALRVKTLFKTDNDYAIYSFMISNTSFAKTNESLIMTSIKYGFYSILVSSDHSSRVY